MNLEESGVVSLNCNKIIGHSRILNIFTINSIRGVRFVI